MRSILDNDFSNWANKGLWDR